MDHSEGLGEHALVIGLAKSVINKAGLGGLMDSDAPPAVSPRFISDDGLNRPKNEHMEIDLAHGYKPEKLDKLMAMLGGVGVEASKEEGRDTLILKVGGGLGVLENKLLMLSLIVDKEGINPKQAAATALQIATAGVPKHEGKVIPGEAAQYFATINSGVRDLADTMRLGRTVGVLSQRPGEVSRAYGQ